MARPVAQWCGERLSEHILQIISMVGSHPVGVRLEKASHTIGLREKVGVGTAGPLKRCEKLNNCILSLNHKLNKVEPAFKCLIILFTRKAWNRGHQINRKATFTLQNHILT